MSGKNPFDEFPAPEGTGSQMSYQEARDRCQATVAHATAACKGASQPELIQGDAYMRLLESWEGKHQAKPDALVDQDMLDDARFSHLKKNEWQNLPTTEEQMRGARSEARRLGDGSYYSQHMQTLLAEDVARVNHRNSIAALIVVCWFAFFMLVTAADQGLPGLLYGFLAAIFAGLPTIFIVRVLQIGWNSMDGGRGGSGF